MKGKVKHPALSALISPQEENHRAFIFEVSIKR